VSDREGCCQPGDFTVTPIPDGYLIGESMPKLGPGPWWSYVAIVRGLDEAIDQARTLAQRSGSKAWFFEGGATVYRSIPVDERPLQSQPT
jgi:hypothetical protein